MTHAGSVWAVDWDLLVVWSKSMSVSIWVIDESSLEHLAVGCLDTWDEVGWGEGGLLSLSVEVLWVAVQGDLSNLLEWVVAVWPDLSDIVDIKSVGISILFWHDLSIPSPGWEISLLNCSKEISGREVLVLLSHLSRLLSSEAFDTLVSLIVVLDEEGLSLSVHPLESMGSISIHVAVSVWSSTVRHENGDLMESLWGERPEVPGHVGVLNSSLWVSLLAMDEVWELHWIFDEEDWCVVSDHVVVALLGVVLDGESTWVSIAIVGSTFSSNSGESEEDWSSLANLAQEVCLGETINFWIKHKKVNLWLRDAAEF